MQPSSFEQSNAYLDHPLLETECLSVFCGEDDEGCVVTISCWKPTKDELDEIARTGRVWVVARGVAVPPLYVVGVSPFESPRDDAR